MSDRRTFFSKKPDGRGKWKKPRQRRACLERLEPRQLLAGDVTSGLVHRWTFDETSGDVAADVVGGANGALLNWSGGEAKWVAGKIGGALAFHSVDNAVVTAPATVSGQWSVAFWVNVTGLGGVNPRIIGPDDGKELWAYLDMERNGGGAFLSHNQITSETTAIPFGTWEHYAFTYDTTADVGQIFHNGVLVATGPFHDDAVTQPWVFGHNRDLANQTDSLDGTLDDLRVYDRILTAPEIAQLAATTAQPGQVAASGTLSVDGKSNIYGAGHATPPGVAPGILPPRIDLPNGVGRTIEFTVGGQISLDVIEPGVRPFAGPEGTREPTDVSATQGISGIQADTAGFLVGVFLDDTEPADPAPAALDFRGNTNFLQLAPALRQTFFIGDGLSVLQTAQRQTFLAPDGATRLYLGLADSFDSQVANIFGPPQFYDDNGGSFDVSYTLVGQAPNQPPTFTIGPDIRVTNFGSPVDVPIWATNISPGPSSEADQSVTFIVSTQNPNLFSKPPVIDRTGRLTFTPAAGQFGTTSVTVVLMDNGGTAAGGDDTSDPQTFLITLDSPNRPPLVKPEEYTTPAGLTLSIPPLGVLANDSDPDGDPFFAFRQTDPVNGKLNLAADGGFTYTPNPGFIGDDSFTYFAEDSRENASEPTTVTIHVVAINNAPTFLKGPDIQVLAGSGQQVFSNWATSISPGSPNEANQQVQFILTGFDSRLFGVPPAISPSGQLTFTPSQVAGTTSVTVTLKDNGGTANGGSDTSAPQTFNITIAQPPPPATPPGIRVNRGVLTITGTPATDTFGLFLGTKNILISGDSAGVHQQRTIRAKGITRLVVHLGDGDDLFQVDGRLKIPALIDGGGGDDVLMGCEHAGSTIILGGDGNDVIMGGHKADIIIGGAGEDTLYGDEGSDLIIGGSTQYDESDQALFSLLKEWSSTRSLAQRVKNVRTGAGPVLKAQRLRLQAGQTVIDNEVDTFIGEGGADWFFADPGIDILRDWARNEPFDRQPIS